MVAASKADLLNTKDLCKLLLIILKNLNTQNMTSSSEQDNLDLSFDEETNNNYYSNTQNGAQKDVPRASLLPLQPVTPSNLTNSNFT